MAVEDGPKTPNGDEPKLSPEEMAKIDAELNLMIAPADRGAKFIRTHPWLLRVRVWLRLQRRHARIDYEIAFWGALVVVVILYAKAIISGY